MKFFFVPSLGVSAVIAGLLCAGNVRSAVLINEIMYHAAPAVPEDPRQEWIELYNSGAGPVNLSGWRFTKGITFNFTGTVIPAGGYLVVAADTALFATNYPGVTNVVGDWAGKLSNNGETIELVDNLGQTADSVAYASEGDWALHRQGEIYPGQPAWWRGWQWTTPVNGEGKSLELINPALSNNQGQNWAPGTIDGGTPGRANSVATNDIAPLILDVRHYPAIPASTNIVTVTASIVDESSAGLSVAIFYRVDGAGSFTLTAMYDDGLHGDGGASDGNYGALLPARPDKTIVEFYIQASDAGGRVRTWPAPTDDTGTQGANALYQVDESTYSGNQPIYRVITTAGEWSNWLNLMDNISNGRFSDAAMNATLVRQDGLGTEVRYNVLVRNRGAGTRAAHPHNLHLAIPGDHDLQGLTKLDMNTRTVHSQVAGNAIFSMAGLPNAYGAPVQVRVNAINLANASPGGGVDTYQFGSYFCFQPYDSDWAAAHLPEDSAGNIYKGVWYLDNVALTNGAVLDYRGTNVANYRLAYSASGPTANTGPYSKQNNTAADDWSDLVSLCAALNQTPDLNYVQAVSQQVNIDEWLKYFAANSLVINMETTLATGAGDDYSMYCGMLDPRFQILNHDLDTVLGQGDTAPDFARSIFKAADIAALNRFLKYPEIAPRYYATLKQMADSTFAAAQIGPVLDQTLGGWVPASYIQSMKAVAEQRRTNVLAQIPLSLSVTSSLAIISGYRQTTISTTTLTGGANAIDTQAVLVNGVPAAYVPWQGSWTATSVALNPGINRVLVQALNTNGVEFASTNIDIWYDDGSVQTVGGSVVSDTTWTAAGGPYSVTSSLTVASGATLTIQPGTTLYLGSGVNFTVASGGRLLAEGTTNAPVRFTVAPGSGASWGGLTVNGTVGSPETRIAFAHFEGNAGKCIELASGTLFLDHATFGTTTHQYLSLDGGSFQVQNCVFPSAAAGSYFELVHGTGGIKSGGRGLFLHNFFGAANSVSGNYNDVVDFTGGQRPGPIVQFINNVFIGSGDDELDLDNTDAWIEGNIFLHAHKNGSPDTSSAISGGNDTGEPSDITIIGNIIYDCDHAALAKQGNFYTLLNNTIVRQTHTGGLDTEGAVICLQDNGMTEGAGAYFEGNIIYDAEKLTRNLTNAIVTFTNNLMPFPWNGPGGGNSTNNPRLNYIPQLAETQFGSWDQAQVMRDWFSLRSGSPALGAGPNGRDMGGVIPLGASLAGEPIGGTSQTEATLTVGVVRSGGSIPAAGFPDGSGYTHYMWRLDDGAWSAETPTAMPITLAGLSTGPHHVDVTGKRDSGLYQDAPELGADALVTASRTWMVTTASPGLRLNEILTDNRSSWFVGEDTPDGIELFNPGAQAMDLSGMGLTDDPANPYKFAFPPGTALDGGQFLALVANTGAGTNFYTGFKLDKNGGSLSLVAAPANGGALLDTVTYGAQLTDFSIGRLADGSWGLTRPTLGGPNSAAPVGDVRLLRLNEWLAASLTRDDFVELYNGDALPVNLGGCFLSEVPDTWPARFEVAPLSFIPAYGELVFIADGNAQSGASHLNFSLAQEWGALGLFAPDLAPLDRVIYGMQTADVSMGRSPNGGSALAFFPTATPGSGNPGSSGPCTISNITINLATYTQGWKYNQSNNLDGVAWYATNYNDAAWQGPGSGLLAFENNSAITPLIYTTLRDPRTPPPGLVAGHAYYFRTTLLVTNDLSAFTLNARMRLDDCAVIYINGAEFSRPRMSAGTITNASFGSPAIGAGTDADVDEFFTIPATWLHTGTNVIAVEVHQSSASSSDIVWGMALDATRTITNCSTAFAVLNEVMANNRSCTNADGSVTDWVELYNPSTEPLDMSGMSLSDDSANPRHWLVPVGVVLGANNYLVVRFDNKSAASATNGPVLNTGFGLSAGGGAVYLFDAGASLVDALAYGQQAADFSVSRVPNGSGAWTLSLPTAGSANIATVSGDASAVRINEWTASVPNGPDWFELYNPSPQPVALGGFCLTDKLSNRTKHLIAPLTFIGVGNAGYATFIADGNTAQGPDHVNFSLDAGGEAIGLFTPGGAVAIDNVTFGTQTAGISEGRLPDGGARRVFFTNPTPDEANWLPLTNVVINEVLTHTDLPLEDAVEFYNPADSPMDISGWFLSDSRNNLRKFRIPDGTVVPAHGYWTCYEYQFNPNPALPGSFSFNSAKGDEAWLTDVDTNGVASGYRDYVNFGPQFNGVSFGRHLTSVGCDFTAMSGMTFGTPVTAQSSTNQIALFRTGAGAVNAYPRVGPVVISEIMFHPPPIGTNDNLTHEFIELHNISGVAVPLYDVAHATNGWQLRSGVDFDFTTNHTIPPGGFLLIVGFDPLADGAALASFRAKYGTNVLVVGPWSGKLSNNGEAIELLAPDKPEIAGPDAGLVPYVTIERVVYSNAAPWPANAGGTGQSLQRVSCTAYGNDPANWTAGTPTAGLTNAINMADSDGDGLPDAWEMAWFGTLDRNGAGDFDGDGMTDLQEYLVGTNPADSASYLKIDSIEVGAGMASIHFTAADGKTYSVLYRDSLNSGAWSKLADVPAQAGITTLTVSDPTIGNLSQRFYRLVTPRLDSLAADTDGDGMPDSWEDANGLNKLVDDSSADPDRDGFTNLQEYLAGTNPHDAADYLHIESASLRTNGIAIRFRAVVGHTYSILYCDGKLSGPWHKLRDAPFAPGSAFVEITDLNVGTGSRFYRLVTPALPDP